MTKKKALTFQQALFLSARNVDLRFETKVASGGYINQSFDSFCFWNSTVGGYDDMVSREWYISRSFTKSFTSLGEASRNIDLWVDYKNGDWVFSKKRSNISIKNALKLMEKS